MLQMYSQTSTGIDTENLVFDRASGKSLVIQYPSFDLVMSDSSFSFKTDWHRIPPRRLIALLKCLLILQTLPEAALEEAAEKLEGIQRFYSNRLPETPVPTLPPKLIKDKLASKQARPTIVSSHWDTGWDLSVDNRNGQRILVIEVKTKLNASPEWAARLRGNILAHGTFPKAPYFLIVFPDRFYLWTDADVRSEQNEPTYTIEARPILQPYFERAGVTAAQISGQSLELIVASWLGEIIHSEKAPEDIDESQQWLVDSGLYDALAGGKFEHEAVV